MWIFHPSKFFIPALLLILLLQSCFKAPAPIKNFSEANQKFLKICKEEYHLNVLTKKINKTLWIYVPIDDPLFDYKGTKDGPRKSNQGSEKNSLQYFDGRFDNGTFYFEYAVAKTMNYAVDYGYKSMYSEEYQKKQSRISSAIFRAYCDLTDTKTENPPEFFMLVISNIKKGVELTSLFNFEDFKQVQAGFLPPEEFVKRNVSDIQGRESIIGDFEGKHLDYHDITWSEFLTKQALNRIRFKYQQSDFKPGDNTEEEMIAIIAETFQAYHFQDFKSVELNNLATQKKVIFEQPQVATFAK